MIAVLDPPATAHNVEVAFAFDHAKPKAAAKAVTHSSRHEPAQGIAMRGAAAPEPIHIDPVMEIEEAQPLPEGAPHALPSLEHAADEHHG